MTRRIFSVLLSTILVIGLVIYFVPFENFENDKSNDKLMVFVTTNFLRDAVENIAKDKVEVECLMDGVDPHQYHATNSDLNKLYKSDVLFYGGLNLEAKLSKILGNFSEHKHVVNTSENIPHSQLLLFDGEESEEGEEHEEHEEDCPYDPHIWFDIDIWKIVCTSIKDNLIEADSKNKDYYEDNFANYMNELDDLDKYIKDKIQQVPQEQRKLITSHDAFQYFGRYNNMDIHGIQGVTTESESSGYDINHTVHYIRQNNIRAVFIENIVSPKLIQSVIESARARGYDLKLGGELYSDSLGEYGTEEGTYIGMYKYNIDTIIDSLK